MFLSTAMRGKNEWWRRATSERAWWVVRKSEGKKVEVSCPGFVLCMEDQCLRILSCPQEHTCCCHSNFAKQPSDAIKICVRSLTILFSIFILVIFNRLFTKRAITTVNKRIRVAMIPVHKLRIWCHKRTVPTMSSHLYNHFFQFFCWIPSEFSKISSSCKCRVRIAAFTPSLSTDADDRRQNRFCNITNNYPFWLYDQTPFQAKWATNISQQIPRIPPLRKIATVLLVNVRLQKLRMPKILAKRPASRWAIFWCKFVDTSWVREGR